MRVKDIGLKSFYTTGPHCFRLGTLFQSQVDATALQTDNNLIGFERVWWGCPCELLDPCNGNYALHHCIYHRAIIADGCRT